MKWLSESGYIRCGRVYQYGLQNAVLTAKGLETLKATPKNLKAGQNFGSQLAKVVSAGAWETAQQIVAQILKEGLRLI